MSTPENAFSRPAETVSRNPVSIEKGSILRDIRFTKKENGILGTQWVSSDPNQERKAIVLRGPAPVEGEPYSVKIIEDTNTGDPKKGKFIAEIVKLDSRKATNSLTREEWGVAEEELDARERDIRRGRAASVDLFDKTGQPKVIRARSGRKPGTPGVNRVRRAAEVREQEGDEAIRDLGPAGAPLDALSRMRMKGVAEALRKDADLTEREEALRKEEAELLARSDSSGSALQVLREVRAEIEAVHAEREELIATNPEAFVALNVKRLKGYRESLEKGTLAETPYVEAMSADISAHLRAGQPVFIYGHLGSGKTELAMHVAKEIAPQGALIISGAKDIALSELYGHQTLEIDKIDPKELDAFNDQIEAAFDKWKMANQAKIQEDPKELDFAFQRILQTHLKTLEGGTVSKFFLGPIYRAMEEGRPVIIDEVNAIPHDVLISLNHALTRKPGDKVLVQQNSGSEITVKEGFGFILTGNLNQGSSTYVDRQDMDPAFLSRLYKVEYDYLPQATEGDITDGEVVSDSELFHLMLATLMSRNGDLELPEGSVDKLWDLAKAARVTQDVFAGKQVSEAFYFQEGGARPTAYRLREGVLSIRTLRKVLKQWQAEGYRSELDNYIWKEFISQSTVASDRAYLYQLFKDRFGFFKGKGWNQQPNYGRSGALSSFTIDAPENPSEDLVFHSSRDTATFAFGAPPERTSFPRRK